MGVSDTHSYALFQLVCAYFLKHILNIVSFCTSLAFLIYELFLLCHFQCRCEVACPRDCEVGQWETWGPCMPMECPLFGDPPAKGTYFM